MTAGPSKVVERVAGWMIPPASREHVLGDLHERYESPLQYAGDLISVVPLVIFSNIRRTLDPVVLLMEAFTFFVSFFAGAWGLGPGSFLYEDSEFFKLAIPTAVALVVLIVADAYASPQRRSVLRPILGTVLAVAFAFLSQAVLALSPHMLLPRAVMVAGSSVALVLVSTLRLLFPPPADRPRGVNGPAYWQRTELAPLRLLPKAPRTAFEYVAWLVGIGIILLIAFSLLTMQTAT